MSEAFGFVEIVGVTAAIDAVDLMAKSADVHLLSWERKLGGRLVTLIIGGDVSAVQAAVDAACTKGIKKPVLHAVIAQPHEEIVKMVERSMSRWRTTGDYPWRM
ncbi:MAG: BMC domain-containing protein [Eubacterium sp.]|nr:BMC domain-containing protein [Eubacterium sp.]